MSDFKEKIWEELNGYNLSTIYFFYVDEEVLNHDFTPTIPQKSYTLNWITFNFNINKVVETINIAIGIKEKHTYYIMCDNALVLLISAFESYLTSTYNNIRVELGKEIINPKSLHFQRYEKLKEKYNEINIDIVQLDIQLWTKLFSTSNKNRGLIDLRNTIVHNGWMEFKNESDMIDPNLVRDAIIIVVQFINNLEDAVLGKYPTLNNLMKE